MRVALSIKNKLPLIDGTLAIPSDEDPYFAAWSRANNVVISWLYNSISKEIVTSILFTSTTKMVHACINFGVNFCPYNRVLIV